MCRRMMVAALILSLGTGCSIFRKSKSCECRRAVEPLPLVFNVEPLASGDGKTFVIVRPETPAPDVKRIAVAKPIVLPSKRIAEPIGLPASGAKPMLLARPVVLTPKISEPIGLPASEPIRPRVSSAPAAQLPISTPAEMVVPEASKPVPLLPPISLPVAVPNPAFLPPLGRSESVEKAKPETETVAIGMHAVDYSWVEGELVTAGDGRAWAIKFAGPEGPFGGEVVLDGLVGTIDGMAPGRRVRAEGSMTGGILRVRGVKPIEARP